MRQAFTLFLVLTILSNCVRAQSAVRITGTVSDSGNVAIPGATVSLAKFDDSSAIMRTITKTDGGFQFDGPRDGSYTVSVSLTGRKNYTSAPFKINGVDTIRLPTIFMLPDTGKSLKEVTVIGKRPLMEHDIDKTVVNVESMIGTAASNTLEVLEKTPGVSVANNGTISLNGKSGVLVLIDGRPTHLSEQDLVAYLRSVPGAMLDKIELMDTPPAKYDAGGSAIINIRLKRTRMKGFTGNVSAGFSQGKYARHNEAVNLNYGMGKINVFGNFGLSKENLFSLDTYDREFFSESGTKLSSLALQNIQKSRSTGASARIGMEYALSKKTIYGFLLTVNDYPRTGTLGYSSTVFNTHGQADSIGTGEVRSDGPRNNRGINLNFLHKFKQPANEISADLNYIKYQAHGRQLLSNASQGVNAAPKEVRNFYYDLPGTIDVYTMKADYVQPLGKKASLETGIKSSFVTNDNDSRYFDINDGTYIPDYAQSNHFIYHENINAAYVSGRKKFRRIGIQFGLRAENTRINARQAGNPIITGTTFTKDYTRMFPTFFISYAMDSAGRNTLSMNVDRRISRPNYHQFNPFMALRDQYSYYSGNPSLGPQYQQRLELKYQHGSTLGLGLRYGRFTGVIFQTTRADGKMYITRPENIASGSLVIGSVNWSAQPAKWWTVNATGMLARLAMSGMTGSEQWNPSFFTQRVNVMNQFSFNKGVSGEISAVYAGRDIETQAIVAPRYRVYAAVQKKVWKDKGSIKLSMEDLFASWVQRDRSIAIKQSAFFHTGESDTQRFGIAFSYRFGKNTYERKRRQSYDAAEAEKGRIE